MTTNLRERVARAMCGMDDGGDDWVVALAKADAVLAMVLGTPQPQAEPPEVKP